jgi:hypothetical protein
MTPSSTSFLPLPASRWTDDRKTVAAAFLTCLILLIPLLPLYHAVGFPMDEGMLLTYPELILKGKLPYRDFETFYGPLNLWVLAGTYAVAGVNVFVERTVGLGYHLMILLGLFLLGRRGGLSIAIGAAVFAAIVLRISNISALAWNGGVMCAIWALVALAEVRPWRVVVGGLLGAAAVLYRLDLGPAVLISALPLVWRLPTALRWRFLASFAAGLTPLGFLAILVGPSKIFENLFLYPVVISNPGRRIPFWHAASWVQELVLLHLFACVVSIIAAIVAWRRNPRSAVLPVFLASVLLAIGITHQCMQRMDYVHVVGSVFVSIAFLPWSISMLFPQSKGRLLTLHPLICLLASLTAVAAFSYEALTAYAIKAWGAVTSEPSGSIFVKLNERQFPLGAERARSATAVLALLEKESTPGQRLFVGGGDLRRAYANDTFFYHMTPWLTPATYFLEINPFSANRPNSRLAADVASADWLILNRLWEMSMEPNGSRWHGSDAPNQVVFDQFELRAVFGTIAVFRRISPSVAPVPR